MNKDALPAATGTWTFLQHTQNVCFYEKLETYGYTNTLQLVIANCRCASFIKENCVLPGQRSHQWWKQLAKLRDVKMSGFAQRATHAYRPAPWQQDILPNVSHHVSKWGLAVRCSPIVSITMLKVRPRCTFTHFRIPLERSFWNLWSTSENHSSTLDTSKGNFRHHTNCTSS